MVFTPNDIFKEYTESDFNAQCLNVFRFQAKNNLIYAQYLSHLKIKPLQIEHYTQIPFLPISLFKTQRIYIGNTNPTIIFTSSSTTGQTPSKHLVADISFYENSFIQSFIQQYGNITDYCVLGLLPSYLERNGSSLVYMTDYLIKQSNDLQSGFYLYDYKKLEEILIKKDAEKKVLLIGVTFALLDFIENRKLNLKQTIVMETGGMKGRKEELTRPEVHEKLKQGFGLTSIH
ncbi:MAG: acyl transferase, partial [Bacteroidia bacterium]|nr:acyl transferase [Bacteroidia bacterium]